MKPEPKPIDPKVIANFSAIYGVIANRRSNMFPIYNKSIGQAALSEGDLLQLIKMNGHDYNMISATGGMFLPNEDYIFVNVVSSPLEIYCINEGQINTRLELNLSHLETCYIPVGHTSMTLTKRNRKIRDVLPVGRESYYKNRCKIAASECSYAKAYSFQYCEDVYLAGTLKFERGRLTEWTLGSGHYMVPEELKQSNKIPYLEFLLPNHLYKTCVPT